jgi:hypothetical protein
MNAESPCSAVLVITADRLDPARVTQVLGMRPDQEWRKGERRSYRTASGEVKQLESIHDWGGWKLWLREPLLNLPIEDQLNHWASVLQPKAESLRAIKNEGASVVMDCFAITSTSVDFHIRADLQAKLSFLGIDLYFALHAHEGKE